MSSKLFYELNRTADSSRTDLVSGTVSGESVGDSLVFDKNRNSIWAKGTEYGIPGVEANNYEEDATFLTTVINDNVTNRPVQTFKGYGGVEYSLYVTPHGNLNIYGFVPVSISVLQSGYMNGVSFVANNTISVEIGTSVASTLTHIKINMIGSSIDSHSMQSVVLRITGNGSGTKTLNASELASLETSNTFALSSIGTINSGVLGTTSLVANVTDIKGNTATANINMLTIFDKCYYFHSEDLGTITSFGYTDLQALGTMGQGTSNVYFEWNTGNLSTRTLNSTIAATQTPKKFLYVLVPSRKNAQLKQHGFNVNWWNLGTISFTNQSGYAAQYKLFRTASGGYGAAQGISITIS